MVFGKNGKFIKNPGLAKHRGYIYTVHPCISKSIFFNVYLKPEMKNIATNCMQEMVSDLSYDFRKMLVSCPQVAS
jgi:hypothetical protein